MKFPGDRDHKAGWRRRGEQSAFTLLEVMVASTCGFLILGSFVVFLLLARLSYSGILAEAKVSDNAANALAFIQSRIRVATSIAVDSTGNTLTLGFDDNPAVDSDGDGNPYNDKDHYETIQFVGTNSTSATACAGNSLVYTPKVGTAGNSLLVSSGVRNLPGNKIFAIPTNTINVVIQFGVVDTNARDRFQSVDIQGVGVPLNNFAASP